MIDFHTHILPGIDDGSRNIETSMLMLYEERKNNGVEHVVFTPHFYANRDSIDNFLKRRRKSIQQLMSEVERDAVVSGMQFDYGAEVYYFNGMGNAGDIRKLCITGTESLLLEMPFCQWTDDMYRDIVNLQRKQGLTIILAHIERYYEFQKKKDIWDRVFELPVIAQMNTGAFAKWSSRSKAIKLAKDRSQFVLGSDAHNMESRKPNLEEGRRIIEKKIGSHMLTTIEQTERFLMGDTYQ